MPTRDVLRDLQVLFKSRCGLVHLDTDESEMAGTVPLAVTMAESVRALRDWARTRTGPAN
jgi:hypothetical protein